MKAAQTTGEISLRRRLEISAARWRGLGILSLARLTRSQDERVTLSCSLLRFLRKAAYPMHPSAILQEVQQLYRVSDRLDDLAEQHPLVSDALITISGSVRNTATMLEVLVETRMTPPFRLDPAN